MATRKRFNYAPNTGQRKPGDGSPTTHDPAFQEAAKRQRRGAEAAAELEAGTSEHLEAYADRFGGAAADSLAAKNNAAKFAAVAEALAHADADAAILAYEEVEVVEIDTVSGPRLVWADRVGEYDDVLEGSGT